MRITDAIDDGIPFKKRKEKFKILIIFNMAIKRVFQPTIDDKISYEHIDAWVDYSMESLNENTNKLTEALIKNSKSSDFLAKV